MTQSQKRQKPTPKEEDKTEKKQGRKRRQTLLLGHRLESLGPSCQT